VPNAYTFAMRGEEPFVVIHTALLELLTPAETQAVIAHELGHLKCEHSVYLTLANLIDPGR
jgi:Zn-dependent protease with chaperone function